MRHRQPGEHGGHGHNKSSDGPGNADIEQRRSRFDEAADADECAEGPDQCGRGNEEGKSRAHSIAAAKKVVSQLMREQNAHDRQREGNSEQKLSRALP